jgi:hypothetical protein
LKTTSGLALAHGDAVFRVSVAQVNFLQAEQGPEIAFLGSLLLIKFSRKMMSENDAVGGRALLLWESGEWVASYPHVCESNMRNSSTVILMMLS